ncbi:MAG: Diguanylate cyclase [uncultured bacterium]|nr:MAG: Diguanylate cyclase [uncultured bacterium]
MLLPRSGISAWRGYFLFELARYPQINIPGLIRQPVRAGNPLPGNQVEGHFFGSIAPKTDMKEKQQDIVRKELYATLYPKKFRLDFIAAIAGDRDLTPEEQHLFEGLKAEYGDRIYVYMLFVLTHQNYPEEDARSLWDSIVSHKYTMEKLLTRPVGISVAAMDYLANIDQHFEEPSMISKRKIVEIADIALKDGLTQLFDVSTFRTKLKAEINRYKRYGSKVSLIMLDIDDFKRINDSRGHQEGDRVLCELSRIITTTVRDIDICSRYGGEEFSVILPQTDRPEALQFAERIRASVEKHFQKSLNVTISLGVATCPLNAKSINTLIAKADKALFQSKSRGKNTVTFFQHPG